MSSASPESILDAATTQLDTGAAVSLDSVARAVGLTKAGVMHHFPTKEALMIALVDAVLDQWDRELCARLSVPADDATPVDRIRAYLDWSLSGEFSESDLVVMSDPKLRRPLTARWVERLTPWLALPDGLPLDERARLSAVRLMADGGWLADAAHFLPPTPQERERIRTLGHDLLKG